MAPSPDWPVLRQNTLMPKPMALPIMCARKTLSIHRTQNALGRSRNALQGCLCRSVSSCAFEQLIHRLGQLCEIGASGLLHGPNGVGKSYLCGCLTEKLPEKRYKILWPAHSSLTGSDLIRSLCRQLGIEAQMRRSDNVAEIHQSPGPTRDRSRCFFRSLIDQHH